MCPACNSANRQGMLFCLTGCGRWFAYLGGEYDSWYLDGAPIVTTLTGLTGETRKHHSIRLQQEAAARQLALKMEVSALKKALARAEAAGVTLELARRSLLRERAARLRETPRRGADGPRARSRQCTERGAP
jgi:hypothetical protein